MHEGSELGAEKSTRMPFSMDGAGDLTVTCRAMGNVVPPGVVCGVPAVALTVDPGSASTAPKRIARMRRFAPSERKRVPSLSTAIPLCCGEPPNFALLTGRPSPNLLLPLILTKGGQKEG